MEPETCTSAQGEDSDNDQKIRDSPPTAGEKSDEGQQVIISEQNLNWYRTTLAFAYLQPAFVLIVKDEMKILQENIIVSFGRKLCAEATAEDIIPVNHNTAQFKHICTAKGFACQTLICLIKRQTKDSVKFYEMLQDTDPQNWLTSPFEFVSLFLKDWMRCDIHDFPDCDITALCCIVNRCKPLMATFASTNINEVKKVRNRTMHQARLTIGLQEMEQNIDAILDFLQHMKALQIKALKNTDEITKAIDIIKQLKVVSPELPLVVQVIQLWLPSARRQFAHKRHVLIELQKNIVYMENELARLRSGQEVATTITTTEEMTFQAKIEKLTDENQKLKRKNEDLAKEKEELEKQIEELNKRLESRSVGEVCRPKALSTQRSPENIGQPEYMTPDFHMPGDGDGQQDTEEEERLENEKRERKEKERLEKEEKERKEKERLENEGKERKEKGKKENEEIQQKIRDLESKIREEEERIHDLDDAKSDLEDRINFLQKRSLNRGLPGVDPLVAGATILTGGIFGLASVAEFTTGATFGSSLGESLNPSWKNHVVNILRDVDTSTEQGCRKGITDLEVDVKRRNNRIDEIRIHIMKLNS